jgi:hypothetical protein
LPGNAPLVFAPAALAFLSAIADDGVPVAVGLVLIVGGDSNDSVDNDPPIVISFGSGQVGWHQCMPTACH